jgi:photosystem II stability/assembly factor-like uncharacterized protein
MRYSSLVLLNLALCGLVLWQVNQPSRLSTLTPSVRSHYDGAEEFARMHKQIRTPLRSDLPTYEPGYRFREFRKALTAARNQPPRIQSTTVTFTERGPSNVPGRTRGLLVDPDDPLRNTWYAGSAGGGVWKTTNAGADWSLITPDLSNLATTVLAMAPSNHNVIYLGTGEGFFNLDGISGNGIFKSTTRGLTWAHLPSTAGFSDINRMVISPTDPNLVVAATTNGIFRTTDGGTSWTRVFGSDDSFVQDLKADPSNFNIQYAGQNNVGVLKSTDGGQTWSLSSAGMEPGGRVEIAVSPVNTNRVFASAEGGVSGVGSDLYVSNDSGTTWSLVNVSWNSQPLDFLGGQGWYDNTIACDPFNADIVYFGGVNLFRLTLGSGTTEVANYALVENGTTPFMFLLSFANIQFSGARLTAGPQAGQRSVEIRFGPGKSQKAHRFTVPAGATSGVPVGSYTYANYVDIPFEAWEVTNPGSPRQLMVSFRDQAANGVFDLVTQNFGADAALNSREYVYVNDVDYASTPNGSIAQAGGQEHRLMYGFFPALANGATWQPSSLPSSTLLMEYTGLQKYGASTITVSDAYNQFDGKNRFITFGADVHPDQHNLVMIPMSGSTYKILSANDGGIFVSNTSAAPGIAHGNWTMSGRTYRTTQFYGAAKRPGFDQYFGGTQDNGTWKSPATGVSTALTNYDFCFGGDGFEVIWNNLDGQKMIGGSQGNNFLRSTNGGATWAPAVSGLFGSQPFVSKLANSKDNPDRIYTLSSSGVFYSTNFGETWTVTPITTKWGGVSSLMDVEVSRANANIVWAGSGMIEPSRNLHFSTDGGVTFAPANNPPASMIEGFITKLASHPTQPQTAYALFSLSQSPKILRTTDLGQTWEDISGFDTPGTPVSSRGFPDVAVYCLYVRADNPDILWAGTEIGIVESQDNGLTWALIPSFPAISVWDMKGQDDQVVIATHGRGIWTATIGVTQESKRPVISSFGTSPKKELMLRVNLEEDYSKLEFYVGAQQVGVSNDATAGEWTAAIPGLAPGPKSVQVVGYRGDAPVHSASLSLELLDIKAVSDSHVDYFGEAKGVASNGFFLGLYNASLPDERRTMHTSHPYTMSSDAAVTILHPVVVSSTMSTFFYEDVVLVEPGVAGAPFGTANFRDYVVMEASRNGLDWVALEDGYDARLHADWLAAFESGAQGSRSLLRQHQVNLLNRFASGDTLLFRYRLSSDAAITGWGAALDYVVIQEEPTGLESTASARAIQVFPNPASTDVTVRYQLTRPAAVKLEIIDPSGKSIYTRGVVHATEGTYEAIFSVGSQPPGVYVLRLNAGGDVQTSKIVVSR